MGSRGSLRQKAFDSVDYDKRTIDLASICKSISRGPEGGRPYPFLLRSYRVKVQCMRKCRGPVEVAGCRDCEGRVGNRGDADGPMAASWS
jgi:hypothetical protein